MRNLLKIGALTLLLAIPAQGRAFERLCHNELKELIFKKAPLVIVDIQAKADFEAHNYENSVSFVNDPKGMEKFAASREKTGEKIVVVSGNGGSDATAAAKRIEGAGVASERVLILDKGIEGALSLVCDCCAPEGEK